MQVDKDNEGQTAVSGSAEQPAASSKASHANGLRYRDINDYLEPCGLLVEEFNQDIRWYIEQARDHYRRLELIKHIAAWKGFKIDLANLDTLMPVYKLIGKHFGYKGTSILRWKHGEVDIPWQQVFAYCQAEAVPLNDTKVLSYVLSMRYSMPRVLVFIFLNTRPSDKSKYAIQDRIAFQDAVINKAKEYIKSTKMKKVKGVSCKLPINQAIMDRLLINRCELRLSVSQIALFRQQFDGNTYEDDSWYWPFGMFKFATLDAISPTGPNLYSFLWDEEHKLYPHIWSNDHGN
jgi:hypothetical protein